MQRYQRQVLLPQVGLEGQRAIGRARVLVVGAGGLGTPAALYLSAAGVGQLSVVDGDRVSESNLHRQVLYANSDIGKYKAQVLVEKIKGLSSGVEVFGLCRHLDKTLAVKLFAEHDIVIDGTDNFSAKFLINDVALYHEKPVVYGALYQFEGQVGVFAKGRGACYRCLNPQMPKARIMNCTEAGVLGPLPGIIGSAQALETLKIILHSTGQGSNLAPLFGQISHFDFQFNETRQIHIEARRDCLCARLQLRAEDIVEEATAACASVPFSELVDVREQDEWDEFHLEGSFHWPLSKLERSELPPIEKKSHMTLICRAGSRAKRAHAILLSHGYTGLKYSDKGVYEY